jgi:hypothetical protein
MGDVAGHRRRQISRRLLRGGCADLGKQCGTGARGPAQVRGVEPGDGGLDARRQVPRVVVEHLRQAMSWVQRAGRCCPQRPDVVPCLVDPVVRLPQRASAQVLVGVDECAPAEERSAGPTRCRNTSTSARGRATLPRPSIPRPAPARHRRCRTRRRCPARRRCPTAHQPRHGQESSRPTAKSPAA